MSQLLLTIDTSGKNGSLALALATEGNSEVKLLEAVALAGGTFSAQLVPQIAALLAKHGRTREDIGAFVVVSGPGSFTGLRVGLAAIKALAEVLQKPIAAVSLLEAVARSTGSRGRILAALDAGRTEIYVGDYKLTDSPQIHSERLLSRDELLTEVRSSKASGGGKSLVTPDAVLAEIVRSAGVSCDHIAYPSPEIIARLGWQHIQRGQTVRPEDLEANYIRRSDAEILSQPRH